MYWTIIISFQAQFADHPFMPHQASGPFSTLTRGAFRTNEDAVRWAKETLPEGAKVRFHQIKE
jgi:hypothetical protein